MVHTVNERKELDVMILELTTKLKPLIEEKKKLEDETKIKKSSMHCIRKSWMRTRYQEERKV